tara:strand:+ start:39 stop:317 length:279 start_codon:yes stop_codon:yes gene_type:complete
MNNRLEKIVLNFLLDGAILRHRVGAKIKNYPKEMRVDAINNLIENSYIKMFYGDNEGKGRIPVFIQITSKGKDFLSQLSEEPTENTVWAISK